MLFRASKIRKTSSPDAGRLGDEGLGHRQRVGGVADGVASAQQHLQRQVRHRGVQRVQPVPRVLLEEPQRDVVGGAAPGLDREQLRQRPGDHRGDVQQVAGADPGGQQGLVRVAEGGVGDRHGLLRAQFRGPLGRAHLEQSLARARRRRRGRDLRRQHRQLPAGTQVGTRLAVGPVDAHLRQVGEQLRAPVCGDVVAQQVRTLVDE